MRSLLHPFLPFFPITPILAQFNTSNLHIYTSPTYPNITRLSTQNEPNYTAPLFPMLGFTQYAHNPIMGPNPAHGWESKYLYNPAAIVIDQKVFLLYRAQNESLVSTIGLAWSEDGFNFTRFERPVLQPGEGQWESMGTEDPRLVRVGGVFYLTYTGFDGTTARLCLATSEDLVHWRKYGPILSECTDVVYRTDDSLAEYRAREGWSKSGAIAPEKVNGLYQMQWGDSYLYTANSTDLIHWNYTRNDVPFAQRVHVWEQALMESAAPLVKTRDGKWIKFYNGVGTGLGGYRYGQYSTGQMLVDLENQPRGPPIARLETPQLQPVFTEGQVSNVLFSEGLVQFKGKWIIYFGEGDAYLGAATAPVQP